MAWKLEVAANRQATSWTDRTSIVDRKTLAVGGVAHRAEIDAGSGFDLADDAGSITLPARRVVRVIEDATTPDTQLFRGRLVVKGMARGLIPIASAKQFDVSMVDYNADFGGLPLSRWRRPAETDHARVRALLEQFLQGTRRASTNLTDTYLQTGSPVNLPAYTYDAPEGGPAGVISHILSEAEFKDCFITEDGELFYGPRSSTVYAADLAITDDNPDGVTSFPPIEPAGSEDGSEWLAGVKVVYRNRRFVYVIDNAVLDAHDVWYTTIVDETIPNLAAATRRGEVTLRDVKNENTSYRCAILLRNTQVDLIKRGQTVSFRSAAAGVLSPLVLRVGRISWAPVGSEHWMANLELDFPRKLAGTIPPRVEGQPGPFVPGVDFEPTPVQSGSLTIHTLPHPSFPTVTWALQSGPTWDNITTKATGIPSGDYVYAVGPGEVCFYLYGEGGGAGVPFDGVTWTPTGGSGTYYPENGDGLGGHFFEYDTAIPSAFTSGPSFWAFPVYGYGGAGGTGGVTDYGLGLNNAVAFELPVSDLPVPAAPIPGQQVTEQATGDGSTTSFATNYPYLTNSLEVFVGGLRVQPTEVDPDAGTFTLPFTPPAGTQILIRYIAADGTDLGTGNDDTPDSITPTIPPSALGTAIWRPLMDGAGNVVTDAGTGEAVMAYS